MKYLMRMAPNKNLPEGAVLRLLGIVASFCLITAGAAEAFEIPGTGSCEEALKRIASVYERSNPLVRIVVPPSIRSGGGIRRVLDGDAVIARVSRPLTAEEVRNGLEYREYGTEAIVFVVGEGVRARSLSIRQLADIYSGKIRTWDEVSGGKGPIRVLYRQEGESSREYLEEAFAEFRNLRYTENGKMLFHDSEMLDLLQKFRNSIGILTSSTLLAAREKITPLSIGGIAPTSQNVQSGKYPLTIHHSLVYRKGALPPEVRGFVDYLFTDEGRKTLSELGISPVAR